jgi:hypothetical protein
LYCEDHPSNGDFAVHQPSEFTSVLESPVPCYHCDEEKGCGVKPPSSLRVELPMSIGPSIGPEPWKIVLCLSVVTFQPKVPAVGSRLPSEAMVRRRLDLKDLQMIRSVSTCS